MFVVDDEVQQRDWVALGNQHWLVVEKSDLRQDWLDYRAQSFTELLLVLGGVDGLQELDLFLEAPVDTTLAF